MKPFLDVAAIVLATICLAGCVSIRDGGGASRALQSSSPSGAGAAIFNREVGPQDTAINFQIVDPKLGAQPITIDFVGDANWKGEPPRAAVWSADGSVIAVQAADFKSWSHAYDFKNSSSALNSVYPPEKRAAAIGKLLNARGGTGQKVLDDWTKFDQFARPLDPNGR